MTEENVTTNYDEVERIAKAMAGSGFFSDARQANQAVVKILAGREMGFGAFASMVGIKIIKEKPTLSANLMAAAIKKSGRYQYKVTENSEKNCTIDFFELIGGKWEKAGTSAFTFEDARRAGTQNLDKFPRNMLFARALSNGARWYCPDVLNGAPVYTPEELGAEVDEDGDIIDVVDAEIPPVEEDKPEPAHTPAPKKGKYSRPMSPEILREALEIKASTALPATSGERIKLKVLLRDYFESREEERYLVTEYLTGTRHLAEASSEMITAMLDWLDPKPSDDGSGEWRIAKAALPELVMVVELVRQQLGQPELPAEDETI